MLIIHLSMKKKEKKKDTKKKTDKKAAKEEESEGAAEGEDENDDKNRVVFKPSLAECKTFVLSSMDMIIKSTNIVNDLESDLMPFLQKQGKSNFKIDSEFPWIKEASSRMQQLIEENIGGPNELLESYKRYEYILNVDKKVMIDELFKSGEKKDTKVPLA